VAKLEARVVRLEAAGAHADRKPTWGEFVEDVAIPKWQREGRIPPGKLTLDPEARARLRACRTWCEWKELLDRLGRGDGDNRGTP
jgi:hypothetical protein